MKCQNPKLQTVSELTQDYMSNFFQRGMAKPLPQWLRHGRDCHLSGKSILENFPAYFQSREELNYSAFEELHKRRFKKKPLFSKYYTVRITT